jgi:uncharacterized protein
MTDYLIRFGREVLLLFTQMSPYLLLGVTVAGLLSVFVKKDLVARHVGGHNAGSVVKASLLGVPLPLCSCGVIPTASYLKKYGASKPAVMSFLISTPQTGVDSIAATWGMLGPLFALFKAVTALLTGIIGGLISFFFDREEDSDGPDREPEKGGGAFPLKSSISRFADFAYKESIDDIAVNFLVGLVLAALISLLIPDNFFEGTLFGSGFLSMLLMVIIGIPMYVCSTSSIPIAVSLILKGFSPGAAYVFLVAGPATNAATLAILAKVLGRKQTLAYLGTIIAGSLVFGALMNRITVMTGWEFTGSLMHQHEAPGLGDYLFSGLFFLLLTASFYRRFTRKENCSAQGCFCHGEASEKDFPEERVIPVSGMNCHHCAVTVKDALESVDGIEEARVDLQGKTATVRGFAPVEVLKAAIAKAGYEAG